MVSVYIIGGSGYTGGELLRILLNHPKVDGIRVSSRQLEGKDIRGMHPGLETNLKFEGFSLDEANKCDFVFTCVPHTEAMSVIPRIDTKVVDLSADYRLKSAKKYEETYKVKHASPELIPQAVFGLPELHRGDIKKAQLVANPGCFSTGAILALWPLVRNFKVERVVIDSKTGVSGAGKKASDTTHFCWANENVIPYKVADHRHIPEMEQELGMKVHFTPHLLPVTRGILTTAHAFVKGDTEKVKDVYKKTYKDEPFTKVVDGIPSVLAVRGSNYCQVGGFTNDGDRLVVFSAIDNLVKGASGQAVQNMNLMAGFKETLGMENSGLCP
ncbi:MAG: N-acetyl-gamma-glutamyl-phosphate reductase [Candidatus Altiarchaeota archaeon]|nr:N-acetyl-gamma-glutamyl-phosphate reductase [Candidatus Altiarchaeota archaeon]